MHLVQFYKTLVVSPLSTSSPSLHETSFTEHPRGDCFSLGALRDSWSWRDLCTGDPVLVSTDHSLNQEVHTLRRIQAQRTRDLDRATRGDHPIWEVVMMTCFVSLKALGATTKYSSMSGTRPLVATTVK